MEIWKDGELEANSKIVGIQQDNRPQTWVHLDGSYSILITDLEFQTIKEGK